MAPSHTLAAATEAGLLVSGVICNTVYLRFHEPVHELEDYTIGRRAQITCMLGSIYLWFRGVDSSPPVGQPSNKGY